MNDVDKVTKLRFHASTKKADSCLDELINPLSFLKLKVFQTNLFCSAEMIRGLKNDQLPLQNFAWIPVCFLTITDRIYFRAGVQDQRARRRNVLKKLFLQISPAVTGNAYNSLMMYFVGNYILFPFRQTEFLTQENNGVQVKSSAGGVAVNVKPDKWPPQHYWLM